MNRPIDATGTDRASRPADPRAWLAAGEPVDAGELVDRLCTDQVDRWRAGERIPAEAYLALHPTLLGGEAAFELIYGEYLVRESLGEVPKLAEFCWRFPEFAERLRRQLGLHGALGEAAEPTETGIGGEEGPRGADGLAMPMVPGFEVMGVLGQGAMSVVYLARQVALNRLVALKVIRARVYADPEVAARFRDEAEAAARFQHPHIIQVYEVGESEGQGFLVLEHAAGGSLQRKLAGNPQPPREAARLMEPLARALHYAHRRGIVHRDLKPANIVLTEEGVPKVTDFGLAKLMERESGLTRTGDIMGTPSYMAPEQARGLPSDVTGAADIYAMGAILYEMLTGRPPFKGSTPLSTLGQAAEQEVLPPGRLQRHLPRELETICLKCLEKEPRRRYETAEHLADDLRRFLEDRPILARRIGRVERLGRWCRREPVKAVLAGALGLAIVVGYVGVMVQARRAEERARAEARERARAAAAESRALDNLYLSRIAQARLEWRLNNARVARQILEECDPPRRAWEWRHLAESVRPGLLDVEVPRGMVFVDAVAFSPDGRRFAYSAHNPYGGSPEELRHPVEIWETSPPRRVAGVEPLGIVGSLSFSPDGSRLAAGGPRGWRIWDATTGAEVRSGPEPGALSYSPDGKELVSCADHRLTFRDADSGRPVRSFASGDGRATYRPDGRVVAVSGAAAVELREVATGREIGRLPHGFVDPHQRQTHYFGEEGPELAFSPDGRSLAVAADPPRVWDTGTGALRHRLGGHDGTVQGIAFSPDGRLIATAGVDTTIRLWDAASGAERSVLRGHSSWVGAVAFHPEGWCLLSGGRQGAEVKLWDLTRHPEHVSLRGPRPAAIHFEPDGRRLRCIGPDGRLSLRDSDGGEVEIGPEVDMTHRSIVPAAHAGFSGDGRLLATVAGDRRHVKLWEARGGREGAVLGGLSLPATHVECSADGGRVAAAAGSWIGANRAREVLAWDAATGQVIAAMRPTSAPTPYVHGRVAIDAAGSSLAFDDYDDAAYDAVAKVERGHPVSIVRVCDLPGGRERLVLRMPGAGVVYAIAFSPDGRRIAAGEKDGRVWIWDARTGAVLSETRWEDYSARLAFSPDGRRLAGVSRSRVQVHDVADGREILILQGAPARPMDGAFNPVLAWSPDGARLACSNWDGTTSVWDAPRETVPAERRRESARGRVFGWHLDQAEASLAAGSIAAAGWHLDRVQSLDPPDTTSLLRRAEIATKLRRLEAADGDYARWFRGRGAEDRHATLAYARLFLIRGDHDGFRRYLGRLLDEEPDRDPGLVWQIGRVAGLLPCPAEQAARVVKLVGSPPIDGEVPPNRVLAIAMAHLRAGDWEATRTALQDYQRKAPGDAWRAFPAMAMAEHRLGRGKEAGEALAHARQRLGQLREQAASSGDILDPEWFEYDLLTREAGAMIDPD